jgi:hypothetical protein
MLYSIDMMAKEEPMDKRKLDGMKKRLRMLRKELAAVGPLMRGSVVKIGTRKKRFYFSLNKDKKTRLIYLGDKREPLARKCSENYRRLLNIVEEMTLINMELLKSDGELEDN